MKKSISPVISVILLIVIAIVLVASAYLFLSNQISTLFSMSEEQAKALQITVPFKATIYNPNPYDLTDYQVMIGISPVVDVYKTQLIKILDENGNEVNFCYEQPNGECNTTPSDIIWVKVPKIPANGETYLVILKSRDNEAVNGDQVFEFYDDFKILNTSKWEVNRAKKDPNLECKAENGILWLVKKSNEKGCNIKAKNFNVKYNDRYVIDFRFKINYVCGTSHDGDGIALVIDGKDTSPGCICGKGFRNRGQGLVVEIFTDAYDSSTYNLGGIGIDDDTGWCIFNKNNVKASIPVYGNNKTYDLTEGIITVYLTGNKIRVHYKDLNPDNGYLEDTIETDIWDPNGKGYFMFGASTGGSRCPNDGRDSAHGIDWVRVRKYADRVPRVRIQIS